MRNSVVSLAEGEGGGDGSKGRLESYDVREYFEMEKFYPTSPVCCSFHSFSFSLLWNISRHDIRSFG